MFAIDIAVRSERGARATNEDHLVHGRFEAGWYAVLGDGAGGHHRGAEASRLAVRCVEERLRAYRGGLDPAVLTHAVSAAHVLLQGMQGQGGARTQMHTTLVALWIDPEARHALWAHVGDSRLYRMRQGVVDVITRDDSVVQRMLAAGMISADQAREHPQKNQLIAALGIEGEIDAHTVVRPVELRNGDAFLLCTDGWWDAFDAATLATTFAQAANPTDWLDAMRQRIEARSLPRQDNFSAIAIWIGDRDDAESQSPEDTLPRVRLT